MSKSATIDGLFDEVENAMNSTAKASIKYNAAYGFPEELYRDYGEEGDGFRVSDFSPGLNL